MDVGKYHTLMVKRFTKQGAYLTNSEQEEVLLPNRYVPKNCKEGDELRVFVYQDHENRITATTEKPHITLHEFAYLKVKSISDFGAFLDWGLAKDLLVPLKEQKNAMQEGKYYLVYLYVDKPTQRLVASAKVSKFLNQTPCPYNPGDEVQIMITESTDLGTQVIIEHKYKGLLYKNETFKALQRGEYKIAYVKKLREDGKIDVTLEKFGYKKVLDQEEVILNALHLAKGSISITDNSDPEIIYNTFQMSKKVFKKTIGLLYKKRLINITESAIVLLKK